MSIPFGYELVFGKPIVFWTGILAAIFIFSAGAVMFLNLHTRYKFPVNVHHRLAIVGLVLALIHMILGLTIYL